MREKKKRFFSTDKAKAMQKTATTSQSPTWLNLLQQGYYLIYTINVNTVSEKFMSDFYGVKRHANVKMSEIHFYYVENKTRLHKHLNKNNTCVHIEWFETAPTMFEDWWRMTTKFILKMIKAIVDGKIKLKLIIDQYEWKIKIMRTTKIFWTKSFSLFFL